jgi:hypothetical protein
MLTEVEITLQGKFNAEMKGNMAAYSKEQILELLRNAASTLGPDFAAKDFEKSSGVNYHRVSRLFGSWHAAMLAAGLTPKSSKRLILPQDLIHEARALAARLGKNTLTIDDWRRNGSCDDGAIRRRFKSWTGFLKEAHLEVGNAQDIPNQELLKEMGRLYGILRKAVSPGDMDGMGQYSSSTYIRRWGSGKSAWNCFVETADTSVAPQGECSPETTQPQCVFYGEIINYSGMLHAPVNEQGVVYLFALLSRSLGFTVEAIQSAFPDAVAKRQLRGQKVFERVRIEFEFQSSSFQKHGHDQSCSARFLLTANSSGWSLPHFVQIARFDRDSDSIC